MKNPYDILPAWVISRGTTSAGTAFVVQLPDQATTHRLVLAHVRLQEIPSDSTPQPAEVEAMCAKAIDNICELLGSTDAQWLHDSLPASFDLTPQATPLATIMLGLIKRDKCRYDISFAPWPDQELPFRLENIDGADIEPVSDWSTIAIPSSGGGAWVVKEFVEVPKDVNDLVKTSVTNANHAALIAMVDKGNVVGAKTHAIVQAVASQVQRLAKNRKSRERTARGRGEKGGRPTVKAWERAAEIRVKFAEFNKLYANEPAMKATIKALGLDCGTRTLRDIIKRGR